MNGQIGDLTFFKNKTGSYQVRMKGGVSADRIATDPRFQRTRENGAEFGRAATAAKKLRDQLRELFEQNVDTRISQRLSSRMSTVVKADAVNIRGERSVLAENLPLLVGLECNLASALGMIYYGKLEYAYDRATGEATLATGLFDAKKRIAKLEGATHVKMTLALLEFSADTEDQPVVIQHSDFIDVVSATQPEIEVDLTASLIPDPAKSVLILIGISYYQLVNGGYYSLTNGAYNALTFVDVDTP